MKKSETGDEMGGRTTPTSSSSQPVNSWTGPTAEEVPREIPHLKIQFLQIQNTGKSAKYEKANF